MKKIIFYYFFISIFILFTIGCYNKTAVSSKDNKPLDSTSNTIDIIDNTNNEGKNMNINKLIINNKEVCFDAVLKIDKDNLHAEIPIITTLTELGATFNRNDPIITFEYNNSSFSLDTSKSNFGLLIPPGTTNAVRKILNEDLIVDSISVEGILKNKMGAEINIDYNSNTIYIYNRTQGDGSMS